MSRLVIAVVVLSSFLTACSGTKSVSNNPEQKAYTKAKNDQARMYRENYRQRKQMERESKKQNRRGWDNNSLGNVFGL